MVVVAAIFDGQHRVHDVGGIAVSATGRRFSRSPPMSDVSSGASSVTVRGRPAELQTPNVISRRRRRRGRALLAGRRRQLKHDADDWPLNSRVAVGSTTAPCRRRTRRVSRRRPLGVAEIVQAIDELASVSD